MSSNQVERQERGDPYSSETPEELLNKPTEIPKPNENEDHQREREDPYHSDMPEWLQEYREHVADDRVLERRDSNVSSSHEPSLEPASTRSAGLGKHSVYTHFPKDRNCEICQRTKITWAPCRRRIDRVVLRAENLSDLITADHKVLSEGSESRNRFLEPNGKPEVMYTDNSLEFGAKLVKSFLESLYVDTARIGNKWDC